MRRKLSKLNVGFIGVLLLLTGFGLALRLAGKLTAQAAPQEQERKKRSWENEEEQREERAREFLKTVTDANGRVRPDLWRRGIAHAERMKIGAQVRLTDPKGKLAGPIIGVQWKQVGPAPLRIDNEQNFQGAGPDSGEVVDLAIDPRNATDRVVYIATNDGGIWKTTDGGSTWRPKTDYLMSLSMGAVALDPGNPSIVYAGTGNPFDGGGIFSRGVGIYKSIDAGETWTTVGATPFTGRAIVRIRLPAANLLLVATMSGLFRSVDGGLSWGNNAPGFNNNQAVLNGYISDLQLDTAAPATTVLAAVNGQGIFRSTDAGATFPAASNLFTATNGAPTANVAFISFAQSTTPNNQTIYASVQDARGQTTPPMPSPYPFLGLYRSTDGGANWTRQAAADASGNGCQCGYDQTIGVDPRDAQRVYIGFQRLFYSADGGGSFNQVSDNKIHFDHHAIYFSPASHITGAPPTRVWVGTDGGVHSSTDAGANWQNLNEGIGTNLFFSLDIGRGSAANNVYSYGGCQDTGTVEHTPAHPGTDWHLGVDGDGGRIAVDPCNPMHAIGTDNGGFIQTSNGGSNWAGGGGFPANTRLNILRFDPNCNVAYAGAVTTPPMNPSTFRLFRSTDNAANFAPVRTFTASIAALALTGIDSNTVWVALTDGTLQVTTNASLGAAATWTTVNVTGAPGSASALAIDPTNTARVVAVYSGFTGFTSNRARHVFMTTDGGTTWANVSGTAGAPLSQNLPDLPVRDVVIDPNTNPHTLIVANDAGVLRTVDNGASWERYGVGLPTVLSTALAIDSNAMPAVLRVGTYGRSVFELSTADNPLLAVNANLAFDPVCRGGSASRIVQLFNVGSQDLHVSSFFRSSGSTDFQLVSGPATPVTIRPGEEVDFTISYTPNGATDQTAEFQISSDDPFQPVRKLTASATGIAPQLNWLIADSGGFGTVCAGSFKDLDLTINNTGQCPLTLTALAVLPAGEFQVAGTLSFPLSVAPGDALAIPIRFSPTSPGLKNAAVRITSNAGSNPIEINVSGTGGQATIATVIPDNGNFGDVCLGDFKDLPLLINNKGSCELRITGISSGSSEFQSAGVMSFPLSIAPGDSITLPLRFAPSSLGAKSATLTITSNDPSSGTKTLDVAGFAASPTITTVIADAGNFGDVCVSKFKDLALTIHNSGACDLRVTNITSTSAEFQVAGVMSFPLVIAPGGSLTIPIRFQPVSYGMKSATITINSNDPLNPAKSVAVSGNVPSATIVTPDMLDFGKVCPGDTKNLTLTIGNSGGCDLIVKSITSDSPEFKVVGIVPFPLVIPPGSTRDVTIQFMPMSFGNKMATLTIMSNDLVTPNKTVILKGIAPPPVIQVIPPALDFGKVCLGTSKDLPLTIRNAGECNLTVAGVISSSPEFKLANPPSFPLVIPPGGTATLTVRFSPVGSTGPRAATLTINSDDPATPVKIVPLTGLVPVSAIIVTGDFDFGPVAVDKVKDQVFYVTNTEPCDLLIRLICEVTQGSISVPSTEFNVISPIGFPILVPGGTTLAVTIRFKPLAKGPRHATLLVFGYDPQTVDPVTKMPELVVRYALKGVGR